MINHGSIKSFPGHQIITFSTTKTQVTYYKLPHTCNEIKTLNIMSKHYTDIQ